MRWLGAAVWLAIAFAARAEDPSAEGLKALDAKNYGLAAQEFTKAIEADPKDYTAHFNLALAESMLAKPADAIAGYKKVLELKPGLYEAQLNLGIVLIGEKQAAEALPYLEGAAGQKPKEPRPRLYLSRALLDTGDFEKAAQSYQTALELEPNSAMAELGLARSLARQNRLADADPHFRRAAELNAGYKDALLELAALYEKSDRKADAVALYRGFPDNAGARERLGLLLMQSGQPAEAIPELEWAVKQSPTSANRIALAQAYDKNHQPEKAMPLLSGAVAEAPNDPELRMAYARELRDTRHFPEAAEQFLRVAEAKPDWAQAWREVAEAEVMLEQYPRAIAALDRVRALKAEVPGDFFLRAIVLDRVTDRKNALAAYQQFLSVSKGQFPTQEFQARQRVRILEADLRKR